MISIVPFLLVHPTPYQVEEMEKVCPFIPLQEETHSADFLSHLQGDEIVVLDNYFFTTDYQRAIKQKAVAWCALTICTTSTMWPML